MKILKTILTLMLAFISVVSFGANKNDTSNPNNYFMIRCNYEPNGEEFKWATMGGFTKVTTPWGTPGIKLNNRFTGMEDDPDTNILQYVNLSNTTEPCTHQPITKTEYNEWGNNILHELAEMAEADEWHGELSPEAVAQNQPENNEWIYEDGYKDKLAKYQGKFWEFTCFDVRTDGKAKFYSLDGWSYQDGYDGITGGKGYIRIYSYDDDSISADWFLECKHKEVNRKTFEKMHARFR